MLYECILALLIISSLGREIIREDGQNNTAVSCTGQKHTGVSQRPPICYCDSGCVLYRDCCDDVTNSSFINLTINPKQKCQRVGRQSYPSYWTVTSCLGGESLTNDLISLPVVDENGIVFANDRIAHCNNISLFSLMDIRVILCRESCDVDLIYSSLEKPFINLYTAIMKSDCKFIINSKQNERMSPRLCVDWLPEGELEKSLSSECKRSQKPIKIPPVVYKNVHCFADLNGFPLPENVTEVEEVYQNTTVDGTTLHILFTEGLRKQSYKENRVCTENIKNNCHRRLIKNWNQTIQVNIDSAGPMDEYHLKYSSIYFLYNFLHNKVNLTLSDAIKVELNSWTFSTCQFMSITMTVKSTSDLNVEEFNRTIAFIKTIRSNRFSSGIELLNGETNTVVSSSLSLCELSKNRGEPIKNIMALSFKLRYVISMMRFLGLPENAKAYCPNLYVYSKERINRVYVDVYIIEWHCNTENIAKIVSGDYDPQVWYVIVIIAFGISFIGTIIVGVFISSLRKSDDDSESE